MNTPSGKLRPPCTRLRHRPAAAALFALLAAAPVAAQTSDPTATISAGTSPVTEGTAAEFTVTLSSAAPPGGVTVNLTVSDADSSDFVASGDEGSKSVTIAQGETSAVYRVATVADTIDEPNDSVTVALASGSGYTLGGTTSASVTVNDDDVIWRATLTAGEFTGRPPRTGYSHSDSIGSLTDSTFAYGTSQGRWDDIVLRKNGRFVMSGVRTSGPKVSDSFKVCVDGTPFEFNPLGADDLNEVAYWTTPYTNLAWTPGRKVRMELIKAADACAPVAVVSLSASPNPVAEGSPVTVTATLSKALAGTVTIPLTLARGTAEVDDFGSLASIAIPAGSTIGTGTITTTNDEDTDVETFAVALGDTLPFPVVVGSPDSVEVTIADDGLSTLNNLQVDPVDGETTELDVSWDAYTDRGPLVYVVQWKTGTEEYGDTARMFTTALDTTSHRITDLAAGTTYGVQVTGNSAFSGLGVAQAETSGTTYAATVSLSASPNPVDEGSPVTVTATLSAAPGGSVTIPLTVTRVTAEADDIGALASITIAADSTTGTGRITTSADAGTEDETFTVALGDTLPSSLTPDSASSVTVTITDTTSADVTPTFGDATVPNQSYPVDTWIEELQLPVASSGNGTLRYTLAGPNGAALPSGLSFTAGDRSLSGTPTTVQTATTYTYKATDRDDDFATLTFTIEVTALGDVLVSNVNKRPGGAVAHLKLKDHGAAQAFTTGSNAAGYTLTGVQLRTKVGTLRAPVFTVAIHTSVNGAPGSPVDTLTAPAAVAPGVNAFTHAGLALDADTTYFVVIEARDTTRTELHVTDQESEDTGGASGWSIGDVVMTRARGSTGAWAESQGGDPAMIRIIGSANASSATPTATISAGTSPVTEGTAAEFTVTLSSAAPSGGVTVSLTVSEAAGSDFVDSGDEGSKTVTVAQGDRSAAYSVATVADANDEPNGSVTVTLGSGAGYTLGATTSASVTVNDDDGASTPTVSLSASPNPVAEGSPVTVTATLSEALGNDVTIPLTLADGTAETGDYGSLESIAISAGSTTGTGRITTTADPDPDDETFTVSLGTLPSSVTAGIPSSVTVTIDDDGPSNSTPTVSLSASPNPVDEGSPVTVTATLSEALGDDVTIPLTLASVTAETDDYGPLASIEIAAGSTTGTGRITTAQDEDTDDETFTVSLGTLPSSVTAGIPSSVTVTIDDDEPAPVVGIELMLDSCLITEDAPRTEFALTVSLTGATRPVDTPVLLSVVPGTADTLDYVADEPSSVTIASGEWSVRAEIGVDPAEDEEAEEDETVWFVARATIDGRNVADSAKLIILDTPPVPEEAKRVPRNVAVSGTGLVTWDLDDETEADHLTVYVVIWIAGESPPPDTEWEDFTDLGDEGVWEHSCYERGYCQLQIEDFTPEWHYLVHVNTATRIHYGLPPEEVRYTPPDSSRKSPERPPNAEDEVRDALALVEDVTPDEAAGALLGERELSAAQLDALDRLGNRNGVYDLGDLLSWIERCRRGDARCGEAPPAPGPLLPAALLLGAPPGRRRRRAGGALTALLAVAAAWSCTGDVAGPPGAEPPQSPAVPSGPGFLTVEWSAPEGARDIGALLELEGPGIEALQAAPGLDLYRFAATAERHRIVLAGPLETGSLLRFRVPDRARLAPYRIRVLQVTGEDYGLRDAGEYRIVVTH